MGNSVYGGFGITRVLDQMLRFNRPGGQGDYAALRVKNFTDQDTPYAQMGFIFTPSASGALVGYTDYRIDPPPIIRLISMHNLGMANQAGIKLLEGARDVMITDTFVEAQMIVRGFTDPKQVFEDVHTIGIIANGLLISIDSVMPDYAYGNAITWLIRGNANELR